MFHDTDGVSGAPGGKILSTWPLGPYGGYAIISGTSMATPFVAACYALVRSQNLGLSVQQVISRMQATSAPVPYVYDQSFPSTVAGQGAGMVNPYRAIMYKTTITPSQLELKDLYIYENAPQTIRIDNASPKAKTYTIKHQGAGYAEFYPYPDILESASGNAYGQPQYPIYGTASFDVTSVTISAGGFLVIDESDFNPTPNDPQDHHFALSGTQGDDVWLVEVDESGIRFVDDVQDRLGGDVRRRKDEPVRIQIVLRSCESRSKVKRRDATSGLKPEEVYGT